MRAARAAVLVIALALAPVIASADDAGVTSGGTVRWERPAPGTIERGAFDELAVGVPAWVVITTGAGIALGAALALIAAARRARGAGR